jgi:hypothetical protein
MAVYLAIAKHRGGIRVNSHLFHSLEEARYYSFAERIRASHRFV